MDKKVLDFNYPLLSAEEISFEKKAKQALRDASYNFVEPREIERYSDKYISSISHDAVMSTVSLELLSPELLKMYGSDYVKAVDEIQADLNENSNEQCAVEESDGSLGGGDDYSGYYNDEDDIVADKEETGGDMY